MAAAPGWFPDPELPGVQRYWDGTRWTEHRAPGRPPTANTATNGMAIASLVCAFVFFPLGIVFGHIALSQIRRTGEQGRGLAIAGLVLSYVSIVILVVAIGVLVAAVDSVDCYDSVTDSFYDC